MGIFGSFGSPDVQKLSASGDVNGLVTALSSKKAKVRSAAAEALRGCRLRSRWNVAVYGASHFRVPWFAVGRC
jgi:hypothetical protein